jgi:hypothetical protein
MSGRLLGTSGRQSRYGAPTMRAGHASLRKPRGLVCGGAPGGAAACVIGRVRPEAVTPGNREWPWAHSGASQAPLKGPRQSLGVSRRSIPLLGDRKKGNRRTRRLAITGDDTCLLWTCANFTKSQTQIPILSINLVLPIFAATRMRIGPSLRAAIGARVRACRASR